MRLPSVRITVRRLMIAVAMAALLTWLGLTGTRWDRYRRLARHHEDVSATLFGEIESLKSQLEEANPQDTTARAGLESSIAQRYLANRDEVALAERYRWAMRRPWVSTGLRPR